MKKHIAVSVLILTKDRPILFKRSLDSLMRQRVKPQEVIVIDSSNKKIPISHDITRSLRIRHIYFPKYSIPQARARAIHEAKGTYVLFLDDDCVLGEKGIEEVHARIVRHPSADFIMGNIVPDNPANPFAAVQDYFYTLWMRENFPIRSDAQWFSSGKPLHFDMACIKKQSLSDAALDVYAPTMFQDDDIDIGEQLYTQGKKMIYDPTLVTRYRARDTMFALLKRSFLTGFSNEYLRRRKHINVARVTYPLSFRIRIDALIHQLHKMRNPLRSLVFLCCVPVSSVWYNIGRVYYYMWFYGLHAGKERT